MRKAYKTIEVIPDLCNGCRDCVKACLQAKGAKQQKQSRIQPIKIKDLKGSFIKPTICLQCGEPACVAACPADVLRKNWETGIVEWDKDKCDKGRKSSPFWLIVSYWL